MLKIRPAISFTAEDLARIYPMTIDDGHYLVRVVLSREGSLIEIVSTTHADYDPSAIKAGSEPFLMPNGNYSVNAWLYISHQARFPGYLRLVPNAVMLPEGDYIFKNSHAKRMCYPIDDVPSNREGPLEMVGTLTLSDDGQRVTTFQVNERLSTEALNKILEQDLPQTAIPAIIGKKFAVIQYIPVPL